MMREITGGILSDADIGSQLSSGQLVIRPLLRPIQSASVDMRLGDEIIIPRGGRIIDPMNGVGVLDQPAPLIAYPLVPGEFVNVCTLEWVDLPTHLVAFMVGKSSLARFGLQVEAAGLVDPGWKGRLTLELKNLGPDTIMLRPRMKICQMYFLPIFNLPVEREYGHRLLNSHYQGSTGVRTGAVDAPVQPAPD